MRKQSPFQFLIRLRSAALQNRNLMSGKSKLLAFFAALRL